MAHCIIHVDGSSYSHSQQKTLTALGWAIVAEHDDQTHEDCGAYTVKKSQGLNGAHEDIALLHALQYMREHGFAPQHTSIYCDDQLLGHAPTYLAPQNYLGSKAERVASRIKLAAKCIGQTHLVDTILHELAQVQMHKVKGHRGHVYQERVDYLAKWSAHVILGGSPTKLSFDDWLHKGLLIYGPPVEPSASTAPQEDPQDPPSDQAQPASDLVALGLQDPTDNALQGPPSAMPYKPSVRIQYAPFARTLADDAEPDMSGFTP